MRLPTPPRSIRRIVEEREAQERRDELTERQVKALENIAAELTIIGFRLEVLAP